MAAKAQRLESHVKLPWQCVEVEVEVEVEEVDGSLFASKLTNAAETLTRSDLR